MTELVKPGVWPAYAVHGRWVSQCSHLDVCGFPADVARFQPELRCSYCGRSTEIFWPAEDVVYSIERVLLMRPHWKNQNWLPGETLHDLILENLEHGILTMHSLEPGLALAYAGDRLTVDALPTLNPRRELVR